MGFLAFPPFPSWVTLGESLTLSETQSPPKKTPLQMEPEYAYFLSLLGAPPRPTPYPLTPNPPSHGSVVLMHLCCPIQNAAPRPHGFRVNPNASLRSLGSSPHRTPPQLHGCLQLLLQAPDPRHLLQGALLTGCSPSTHHLSTGIQSLCFNCFYVVNPQPRVLFPLLFFRE